MCKVEAIKFSALFKTGITITARAAKKQWTVQLQQQKCANLHFIQSSSSENCILHALSAVGKET